MPDALIEKIKNLTPDQRAELYQKALRKGVLPSELPVIHTMQHGAEHKVLPYQERMWLMEMMGGRQAFHNIPIGLRISGELDADRLFGALQKLCDRHRVLRTCFKRGEEIPVQVIIPEIPVAHNLIDLSQYDPVEREQKLSALSQQDAAQPFDIYTAPLWRMHLVKLSSSCHVLLFTIHHLICDGQSIAVLFSELWKEYEQPAANDAAPDFFDYIDWFYNTRRQEHADKCMQYWKSMLERPGLPVLNWTHNNKATHKQACALSFTISQQDRRALEAFSKEQDTSAYVLLLSIHFMALSKITGDKEITIGSPISRREHAQAEQMVGLFVDTAVLLFSYTDDDTYLSLARKIRTQVLQAMAQSDISFLDVSRKLNIQRTKGRAPLFQNIFTFGALINSDDVPGGLNVRPMFRHHGSATLDMAVTLVESEAPHEWLGWISFNSAYCTAEHAQTYVNLFRYFIKAIVHNPAEQVCKLMSAADSMSNKNSLGHTALEPTIYFPGKPAIADGTHSVSYADVDKITNRLARTLQNRFPNQRCIGIYHSRNVYYFLSIIAILKANKAYLPLGVKLPMNVRDEMIHDAQVELVIHDVPGSNHLPVAAWSLQDWLTAADVECDWPLDTSGDEENPAYVLYTSGSMGKRRGVVMGHSAAQLYVSIIAQKLHLSARDKYLHLAPFSFSSSVRQFFAPLHAGAMVYIAGEADLGNPSAIASIIRRQDITVIDTVPSMYKSLVATEEFIAHSIRAVVSSGEILKSATLEKIRKAIPPLACVYNIYGQTESIGVSINCINSGQIITSEIVPAGKPLNGIQLEFINEPGALTGEIVVHSPMLMNGYLNEPAGEGLPGKKLSVYKTGDVGFLDDEGNLQIIGRNDLQFKINGQRVNMAEVESAICSILQCREALAITSFETENGFQLIAFVVKQEGIGTVDDLLGMLKEKMVPYMCPSRLYVLDELPRTSSGKTDFSALRQIDKRSIEGHETVQGNNSPIQEWALGQISAVLGKPVRAGDNLFRIGADSISIGRISSALRTGPAYLSTAAIMKCADVAALLNSFSDIERKNADTWARQVLPLLEANQLTWIKHRPGEIWNHNHQLSICSVIHSVCSANATIGIEHTVFCITEHASALPGPVLLFTLDNREIAQSTSPGELIKDIAQANAFTCLSALSFIDTSVNRFTVNLSTQAAVIIQNGNIEKAGGTFLDAYKPVLNPETPQQSARIDMAPVQKAMLASTLIKHKETAGIYHIQTAFSFNAAWDPYLLRMAWKQMEQEHEVLQYTCNWTAAGDAYFKRNENLNTLISADDWSIMPFPMQERRQAFLMAADIKQPFHLNKGPLARIIFARTGENTIKGLLSFHHIILDGRSKPLLIHLFIDAYKAMLAGEKLQPNGLIPFSEYAARNRAATHIAKQQHTTLLPADVDFGEASPEDIQNHIAGKGFSKTVGFNGQELQLVQHAAATAGVTLATVCCACWALTLAHYANEDQVSFGVIVSNAGANDMDMPLGCMISARTLAVDINNEHSIQELLVSLQDKLASINEQPSNAVARSILVFDNIATEKSEVNIRTLHDITDVPLEVQFSAGTELKIAVKTSDAANIPPAKRFANHLDHLLRTIPGMLHEKLSGVPLVPDAERYQLLVDYNDTAKEFPLQKNILQVLEEQAASSQCLVSDENGILSLRQVMEKSAALSSQIQNLLVHVSGEHVLIMTRRNRWFLIGMLAAFRINAAYTPLDPEELPQRCVTIIRQTQARAIITDKQSFEYTRLLLSKSEISIPIFVADEAHGTNLYEELNSATPADVAYTIFTSGTTGVPKGAQVLHRGMLNHIYAKITDLALTPHDVVAQTASPLFDVSVWQFLAPLAAGGSVHIFPAVTTRDALSLLQGVESQGITVLEIVPSFLHVLLEALELFSVQERPLLARLRWLMLTGELLTQDLCARWYALYPGIPIINAYGPTECSDDVTHHVINERDLASKNTIVPIGKPIANTRLAVLDRFGRPQPRGVPGELYVGGVGVGKGYLRNPGQTQQSFVPCHLPELDTNRLYKTGDMVRMNTRGELVLLGRTDNQVKINGQRIELENIEAVFEKHPHVKQAICLIDASNKTSSLKLVINAVKHAATDNLIHELRMYAAEHFPSSMRPVDYILIDAVPTLPSGKADRKALQQVAVPARSAITINTPASAISQQVREIWQQLLQVENIKMEDNFFDLGGHSLTLISMQTQLRKKLHVKLPLEVLFDAITLQACIDAVENTLMKREYQ